MEILKFTKDHFWVRLDGTHATIGLSEFGLIDLGEIQAIQLPEIGDAIEQGEAFGEVESTRTVSDLLAPVSGTISAINQDLEDAPELLNEDPHDEGWLVEVDLSDEGELEQLLDVDAYESLTAEGD